MRAQPQPSSNLLGGRSCSCCAVAQWHTVPAMTSWNLRHCVLAAGLLAAMVSAGAAPAPWFWWESKINGQRVCAQTMPQQGWRKAEGPFRNAQCQPERGALRPR